MIKVTMDQIIAFSNNGDFFSSATLPLKGAYKLNKIKKAVEKGRVLQRKVPRNRRHLCTERREK